MRSPDNIVKLIACTKSDYLIGIINMVDRKTITIDSII